MYNKLGHVAKVCRAHPSPINQQQANLTTRNPSEWIVDSGASHHITSNLHNLNTYSRYGGKKDIMANNSNSVPITHISFSSLKSSGSTFKLNNVFCPPMYH